MSGKDYSLVGGKKQNPGSFIILRKKKIYIYFTKRFLEKQVVLRNIISNHYAYKKEKSVNLRNANITINISHIRL